MSKKFVKRKKKKSKYNQSYKFKIIKCEIIDEINSIVGYSFFLQQSRTVKNNEWKKCNRYNSNVLWDTWQTKVKILRETRLKQIEMHWQDFK